MGSRFRTSFTQREGATSAKIHQGRIVNINLVNWTVDVVSTFDRKRFFEIQVGSPYQHFNRGEGISIFPEVGAVCTVCEPSDSSPPYVSTFLMPMETVPEAGDASAPVGTRSHGSVTPYASDATFAGGRSRAKPGDIMLRTRDNNFVVLHRGGVLQIGATELAQRIFIPVTNLVTDIAENYSMHNAGGSIVWGLQDGPSLEKYPSQYLHTFRVFANDRYADVRLALGKVYNPIPEPDGGIMLAQGGVGQAEDSPIICELTVAPNGFVPETGDVATGQTSKQSVFKFVFDRTGNTLLRCEGTMTLQVRKAFTLVAAESISISTEGSTSMTARSGTTIDGGDYAHLKGKVVRLGPGTTPVALQGGLVRTTVAAVPITVVFASMPMAGSPTPGVLTVGVPGAPVPLIGSILNGESNVLG